MGSVGVVQNCAEYGPQTKVIDERTAASRLMSITREIPLRRRPLFQSLTEDKRMMMIAKPSHGRAPITEPIPGSITPISDNRSRARADLAQARQVRATGNTAAVRRGYPDSAFVWRRFALSWACKTQEVRP